MPYVVAYEQVGVFRHCRTEFFASVDQRLDTCRFGEVNEVRVANQVFDIHGRVSSLCHIVICKEYFVNNLFHCHLNSKMIK